MKILAICVAAMGPLLACGSSRANDEFLDSADKPPNSEVTGIYEVQTELDFSTIDYGGGPRDVPGTFSGVNDSQTSKKEERFSPAQTGQIALPKIPEPPPMPGPTDPPPQITQFFAGKAKSQVKVGVTVFVLASKPQDALHKRTLFLGQPIARTIQVPANSVESIVDKLDERESYSNGDIGCIYPTGHGIRLTHNDDTLDFELNCGHLFFTAQGHSGSYAIFSGEMITKWNTLLKNLAH